jgi:hypothetical protein
MKRWICQLALLGAALLSGCVERRFVIESVPSGAQVLRNGQPIGFTPVDDAFVYYGKYDFTLIKDGFETLHATEKISAPWYEIPPFDFISENLVPWKIHDVRRLRYQMNPLQATRFEDVLQRGQQLREQGRLIGDRPYVPRPVQPPPAAVPAVGSPTPSIPPQRGGGQ